MLEAKGLITVEDILSYTPFRYEDRSNMKPISQLAPGEMATIVAEVRSSKMASFRRRNLGLFEAQFTDASRGVITGKWFHGGYLADTLIPGRRVALYGKVEYDNYAGEVTLLHPEFELLTSDDDEGESALHVGRIVPIYEAAGKVNTRILRNILWYVLTSIKGIDDPLPEALRRFLKLPDLWQAVRETHFPPPESDMRLLNGFRSQQQFRLIFEEFFWLECGLALKRRKASAMPGIPFQLSDRVREQIVKLLPFKPTGAQKKVLGEIAKDMCPSCSPDPRPRGKKDNSRN